MRPGHARIHCGHAARRADQRAMGRGDVRSAATRTGEQEQVSPEVACPVSYEESDCLGRNAARSRPMLSPY